MLESDCVERTTVYDPKGNNIGSIRRLMIEKLNGQVAYAVMSFGGFLDVGVIPMRNRLVMLSTIALLSSSADAVQAGP